MAGFQFFERDLKLATAGMEPEAINKALAAFAKQELKRVIGEGIASPTYERYVNGVQNAPEDAVKAPGPIVYEFVNWPLVINAALEELRKRGPRSKSGRFASSYIVIVARRIVVTDFTKLRSDAEIIITNAQPYVRKAEVGYLGIPEQRLFHGTARVMGSRFRGAFTFESKFLTVPSGIHAGMPYILKGDGTIRMAAQNRQSSAFRAGRDTLKSKAGHALTYPSIIINPVS
ncbi:hypothetical protein [Mesorhizobium sp.]|uniref:hypothetical protein n=1 Tax=Mesorhizobium sp. TaxID=1871066 RepID=UPI00257C9C44|nr:hypothetical protein [Mesorhizobium sp.]